MEQKTKEELRDFGLAMFYLFCILITSSFGAVASFWIFTFLGVL